MSSVTTLQGDTCLFLSRRTFGWAAFPTTSHLHAGEALIVVPSLPWGIRACQHLHPLCLSAKGYGEKGVAQENQKGPTASFSVSSLSLQQPTRCLQQGELQDSLLGYEKVTGAQGEKVRFQERETKGLQNTLSLQGYVCIKEPAQWLQLCSMIIQTA